MTRPALASIPPLSPEDQAKPYPPASWKTKGRVWVGAYRVADPPPLPTAPCPPSLTKSTSVSRRATVAPGR